MKVSLKCYIEKNKKNIFPATFQSKFLWADSSIIAMECVWIRKRFSILQNIQFEGVLLWHKQDKENKTTKLRHRRPFIEKVSKKSKKKTMSVWNPLSQKWVKILSLLSRKGSSCRSNLVEKKLNK